MSSRHAARSGSSTSVIELNEIGPASAFVTSGNKSKGMPKRPASIKSFSRPLSDFGSEREADRRDQNEILPSPTTAVEALQTWRNPRVNMVRLAAAFTSFIVLGANDAALGALIPYLETYYSLTYTIVSLAFLSPLAGYTASALLSSVIHLKLGQRGVAFIGPLSHILAYLVTSFHPPFPAIVVVFAIAGFGSGLQDAAWNAWVGGMANANEIMGVLHGFYGLGAVIAPLVATTMITRAHLPWYYYYYVMLGIAVAEFALSVFAFWRATAAEYRNANPRTTDAKGNRMTEALFRRPSARVTWVTTFFLICYMGVEVALGGWITVFMLNVRRGTPFASGMVTTGFWLGMTLGRVILGFVTPRIGENLAVIIYIPLTIGLELLFWLVPQFYVSAVAVGLQGFFLGPLFPAAMVVVSKLLPRHLHVGAIGFSAAAGMSGAALFPFAVGAIAQTKGVQVLQPIILALLCVILGLWLCLPGTSAKDHEGERPKGWKAVLKRKILGR